MPDERGEEGVPATVQADAPTAADGTSMHLGLTQESVSPYCIVVGDPDRAEALANQWMGGAMEADRPKFVHKRGFCTATGTIQGLRVTIATHHIAGGVAKIACEELVTDGARVLIRVGSCSALIEDAEIGDTLIWEGALRRDGASDSFAAPGMPAYATPEVVIELNDAAAMEGARFHRGWGVTTDDFYQAQGRPGLLGYVPQHILALNEWAIATGAFAFEMEMALLFAYVQAHERKLRKPGSRRPGLLCGGVTAVYANRRQAGGALAEQGIDQAFRIAIRGLKAIAYRLEPAGGG